MCLFGLFTKNSLISMELNINWHTFWSILHISSSIFWPSDNWKKSRHFVVIGSRNFWRWNLYTGHERRKCASSSILWGQKGHTRSSRFSRPWWRPTSIINLWFESLNLVTQFLIKVLLISDKYGSRPVCFLKRAYVLSLLFSVKLWIRNIIGDITSTTSII